MSDAFVDNQDLTILSVNFKGKFFLDLNYACTMALNNADSLNWVIVDNTPDDADGKLSHDDDRFKVVPGVEPPRVSEKFRASYHHGAALNKGKEYIKTRFALILDPDFFIVRKNWIVEVLAHMADNRLDFFGVPWHPGHWRKYRYFPCVHCLFINLNRVSLENTDFTPDLINNPSNLFYPKLWIEYEQLLSQWHKVRVWWWLLQQRWQAIKEDTEQRSLIGSSRDTGYYLYQRYGQDNQIRCETVQPVFRPGKDRFMPASVSGLQYSKAVELLFPDKKSYVPKRRGYFTRTGFRELGYTDEASLGWEEFVWRKKPFGFHVRGSQQSAQNIERVEASLVEILRNLTGPDLLSQ